MKNSCLIIVVLICFFQKTTAQNSALYDKGKGLEISTNNREYLFNIGGFIQPAYRSNTYDGNFSISSSNSENFYKSKASVFTFGGEMKKEKLSFFMMSDFSLNEPLQEAWLSYHLSDNTCITFGQMLSFTNNREMMYRENNLQMNDRSLLSENFSNSGREFGVFIKTQINSSIGEIVPMFALTSGDGKNSFGNDSRDVDKGKYKLGGRIDYFPFGKFSNGNMNTSSDIVGEEKVKLVFGIAGSVNNGASNNVGEGHGDFILYDSAGLESFPDYNQIYFDALFKYAGFSFLFEYVDSSVGGIDEIYINNGVDGSNNAELILSPTQISNYMVLGEQFNTQMGYVTNFDLSFDLRYGQSNPEFGNNEESILAETKNFGIGLTKFFGNNIKVQAMYNETNLKNGNNFTTGEILMQVIF